MYCQSTFLGRHLDTAVALHGDELRNAIVQTCPGIDNRPPEVYEKWPDASNRLRQLWYATKDDHYSMLDTCVFWEIVVKTGTVYTGTRIFIWNPNPNTNVFHAILADEGFGFDLTATAVTKDNYLPFAQRTDQWQPDDNWRLITTARESPHNSGYTRMGLFLTALVDPEYQQEIAAPQEVPAVEVTHDPSAPAATVLSSGVRSGKPLLQRKAGSWETSLEIRCSTVSEHDGGKSGCMLMAGHPCAHRLVGDVEVPLDKPWKHTYAQPVASQPPSSTTAPPSGRAPPRREQVAGGAAAASVPGHPINLDPNPAAPRPQAPASPPLAAGKAPVKKPLDERRAAFVDECMCTLVHLHGIKNGGERTVGTVRLEHSAGRYKAHFPRDGGAEELIEGKENIRAALIDHFNALGDYECEQWSNSYLPVVISEAEKKQDPVLGRLVDDARANVRLDGMYSSISSLPAESGNSTLGRPMSERNDAELRAMVDLAQAEIKRREVAKLVEAQLQEERRALKDRQAEIEATQKRQADKEVELDERAAKQRKVDDQLRRRVDSHNSYTASLKTIVID